MISSNPALQTASQTQHVLRIARKEFSDRLRSGWVVASMAVWLGAIGLTSFYGLAQIGHVGVQGYERTVVSLLNLVQYLAPLLGLLLGHDLIVSEREDRTLGLILASGVNRSRLLLGKFLGGCLTVTFPLVLGFLVAGTVIYLAAQDRAVGPFLLLAGSGLMLGNIFLGLGLMISTLCRSRVQSLVSALIIWCVAVFAFDLLALGMVISAKAPTAAREIELLCDATHLNSAADLHSAYDTTGAEQAIAAAKPDSAAHAWLLLNPIDTFRAINLARQIDFSLPWPLAGLSAAIWLGACFTASVWRFRSLDL